MKSFIFNAVDPLLHPLDSTPKPFSVFNPFMLSNRQVWALTGISLLAIQPIQMATLAATGAVSEKTDNPWLGIAAGQFAGLALGAAIAFAVKAVIK